MNGEQQPPTPEELRRYLAGEDSKQQQMALWFMGDDADGSYLSFLHEMMRAEDEKTYAHFAAGAGILRLEGVAQFRAVVEQLAEAHQRVSEAGEHSEPLQMMEDQLWEVIGNHPLQARAQIEEMLKDERASVRGFAAFLFGASAQPGGASPAPLLAAMEDDDPFVRMSAESATAHFKGNAEVIAGLLTRLDDPSEKVRGMAAFMLGQMGDKGVVPALKRVSQQDPSKEVRGTAKAAYQDLEGWNRTMVIGLVLGALVVLAYLYQMMG